ncbi:hypothetical protein [Roseomonas marmotae]|uniref:Uncharacterized protein n=1 Tax=Roseomonas marmotae TaxID=2768161 RepID=A0ABS3KEV8_9PROT|nr:hypothetical protein [Roseomonas marmotae]MBO1075985.1 hypothetical protein [Roseomonas marmotae]QTI80118.1 hypothetical protein IAI58_04955 [Roseomonas marmotae]
MSSVMNWSLDARTPVRLLAHAAEAPPGAVVLAEDGAALPPGTARVERYATPAATAHPIGCACCQPRSPAAIALDRLFLARMRGETPWFKEIVALAVTDAGRQAVLAALQQDNVISARFRAEG